MIDRRRFFRLLPAAPAVAVASVTSAPAAKPVVLDLVQPGEPMSAAKFNKTLLDIQRALNAALSNPTEGDNV